MDQEEAVVGLAVRGGSRGGRVVELLSYEEFTRLAETRLARHSLNDIDIVVNT